MLVIVLYICSMDEIGILREDLTKSYVNYLGIRMPHISISYKEIYDMGIKHMLAVLNTEIIDMPFSELIEVNNQIGRIFEPARNKRSINYILDVLNTEIIEEIGITKKLLNK